MFYECRKWDVYPKRVLCEWKSGYFLLILSVFCVNFVYFVKKRMKNWVIKVATAQPINEFDG